MSFNHLQPAKGYYVLEPEEIEAKGTFRVTEDANTKPEVGKIVGVGGQVLRRDKYEFEPEFNIGDVVAYKPYTSHKLKIKGQDRLVVAFQDVVACLEERPEGKQ